MRSSSSVEISPALFCCKKDIVSVFASHFPFRHAFESNYHAPLVQIDIGLLAHQIRIAAPNTLDARQRIHDLLLAVDIGVQKTQDELEVRLLAGHERCQESPTQNTSQLFASSSHPLKIEKMGCLRKHTHDGR